MEITWQIEDGYMGRSRPQHTSVDDDDILSYDTVDEAMEMIDQAVRDDFEQKISWYFKDRAGLQAEIEKLFESKEEMDEER